LSGAAVGGAEVRNMIWVEKVATVPYKMTAPKTTMVRRLTDTNTIHLLLKELKRGVNSNLGEL